MSVFTQNVLTLSNHNMRATCKPKVRKRTENEAKSFSTYKKPLPCKVHDLPTNTGLVVHGISKPAVGVFN